MEATEAIKERLTIEDVVGEYVTLKRAGKNFKGLCPFHGEKTPSFMVNPERGIYHCFGCHEGGDMFSFIMKSEGMDFLGALELLARKSGVDLSQYGRGDAERGKQKEKILTILDLSAKYYQTVLSRNPHALSYALKERGLSKETLTAFRIGYASTHQDALYKFLVGRGYNLEDIKLAGLLVSSSRTPRDIFRSRLMIPLADGQGKIIGFTGRLIGAEATGPKYLNSPQTMVYDKSRHVFGLHLAKQAIRQSETAVLVEGNMDVIACQQAGFANVVATAGTAFTTEQLKQLSRLAGTVVLAFDNDAAGVQATLRAIDLAQKVQVTLKVAPILDGKDPDELVRQSPEKWEMTIKNSKYALDWLFEHYSKLHDPAGAEGKRALSDLLIPVIANLYDTVEQEHYYKRLAEMLDVSVDAIKRRHQQPTGSRVQKHVKYTATDPDDERVLIQTYLSLITTYPDTRVSMDGLEIVTHDPAVAELWQYLKQHPGVPKPDPIPEDLRSIADFVKILVFSAEHLYGRWKANERVIEAIDLAQRIGKHLKRQKLNKISEEIGAAEERGDQVAAAALLENYRSLLKED